MVKHEWKPYLRIGISIFILYLCIHYWSALSGVFTRLLQAATPLLIGAVLAYLLNLLMTFYERHYFPKSQKRFWKITRKPVCTAASILTLLAIVTLVVWLVLPEVISCIQLILTQLPGAIQKLITWLQERGLLSQEIASTLASIDWQSRIGQIAGLISTGITGVVNILITTVSSLASGLFTAFLSIIFAVYLLSGKEQLKRQSSRLITHYLPKKTCDHITYVASIANNCFRRYIVGQCTEALILGLLCTLGMLILRLPYAAMIGPLIAFTALVPVAGAFVGAALGAFLILMVSPAKALVFLIFVVVLQQLEGNLIYPKVVGSSIGLPAMWVLAAVTLGGGLMGIPGMLLGVPMAATLYRIVRNDMNRRARKQAAAEEPAEQ
ncbi:MAG: AI-2E family transporter [Clostridia bacterium]|nr:AI-2E family transporter [Clostridia bacterium]